MAAHRANIRAVVLPEGNRKDVQEVPEETRQNLEFVFAERVEDVWKRALLPLVHVKEHGQKSDEPAASVDEERPVELHVESDFERPAERNLDRTEERVERR